MLILKDKSDYVFRILGIYIIYNYKWGVVGPIFLMRPARENWMQCPKINSVTKCYIDLAWSIHAENDQHSIELIFFKMHINDEIYLPIILITNGLPHPMTIKK